MIIIKKEEKKLKKVTKVIKRMLKPMTLFQKEVIKKMRIKKK